MVYETSLPGLPKVWLFFITCILIQLWVRIFISILDNIQGETLPSLPSLLNLLLSTPTAAFRLNFYINLLKTVPEGVRSRLIIIGEILRAIIDILKQKSFIFGALVGMVENIIVTEFFLLWDDLVLAGEKLYYAGVDYCLLFLEILQDLFDFSVEVVLKILRGRIAGSLPITRYAAGLLFKYVVVGIFAVLLVLYRGL